jgi:peptidyl-prolyl cis-trans isomerase D
MLQAIRERAQGWIAWLIVGLISVPFALWGIQSYVGVSAEPIAATVDGVEITQRDLDQRFQRTRSELRERLGSAYRPEEFDDQQLRREVLDDMIREHLVLETSRALGMRASDQEVRVTVLSDPAFQNAGRFDKGLYETRLRQSGMVPAQFEDRLRQRLLATQLAQALVGTEVVTNRELDEALRLTGQKRDLSYLTLPAANFASDAPIPEEDITRYFEANAERFQDPEQVKVEYLVLDAEQLPGVAAPSEAKLREAYEAHPERFGQPERRRARHILLSVPSGADAAIDAQAKAGIEAARERIVKGEDFAAVAKEISQDPGTKTRGGDLGAFGRGVMDPAFEQAAFALEPGQVSEPVRSRFGYHLIETTEVLPASVKPFEEVKAELIAEVGQQEVSSQFFDLSERLATLAYETPDSLAPAAEQLGLAIQTSDWIPRGGGQGVFASTKILNAAFSDDLVRQGVNSELIEPEKERMQAVVLRVLEHRDAAAKPLDQVRDEIVSALRTERAQAAALTEAKALQERLMAGAALAEIAGGFTLSQPGAVTRNEAKVPGGVRDVAFRLPRPAEGQAGTQPVSGVATLPDGAALVLVSAVTDGDPAATPEPARLQQRQSIARSIGSQAYQHLVEDLESRAKVERKPLAEGSNLE